MVAYIVEFALLLPPYMETCLFDELDKDNWATGHSCYPLSQRRCKIHEVHLLVQVVTLILFSIIIIIILHIILLII